MKKVLSQKDVNISFRIQSIVASEVWKTREIRLGLDYHRDNLPVDSYYSLKDLVTIKKIGKITKKPFSSCYSQVW